MASVNVSRPPARNPSETTYNRACDACRQHKVRCLLPESESNSRKCQRCAKTDKECLFTAPQKRKQRKRTDARVAELEREVHAMRALFEKKEPADLKPSPPTQSPASSELHHSTNTNTFAPETKSLWPQQELQGRGNSVLSFQNVPSQQNPQATSPTSDVIERGIISLDQARTLFDIYVKDLVPIFPAVPLPQFRSVEELRTTRPILFLAVMAASSGKLDPTLYSILQSETILAYAYRTLMLGEKSLELVQAMLVTVVWYYPPGKFSQLKFYEYIHMAVTMAVDIGIGSTPSSRLRRAETDASSTGQETLLHSTPIGGDAEDLEKRRTFLACYIFAAGAAVNLRRTNMMRFNNRISDCIETLCNSSHSSSFDKRIASWAKIISIAEEVSTAFSFDDPGAILSLSEPRVQFMLKGFERELEVWRAEVDPTNPDASLMIMYHNANIFMHELALHIDHLPEDFKPPYRLDKISSDGCTKVNTSQYIDSITACILSAQATLDIFLSTDIETLRAFPVFNYVRGIYAMLVLIKLHASTSSLSSPISGAVDIKTLKLEFYMDSLIDHVMLAVGSVEFRSAFMFVGALVRLRSYYKQQRDQINSGIPLQPMSLFGPDDSLLPDRASIESPRDYSTPLSTELDVPHAPSEIQSDGAAATMNEYGGIGGQAASSASPQFFDSNMTIDDDMMAIFNDIGQSFDGEINAWEPRDMNNERFSSGMDDWNILF